MYLMCICVCFVGSICRGGLHEALEVNNKLPAKDIEHLASYAYKILKIIVA